MKQQLSLLIISISQLAQAQTAPPGDRELFKRSTPRISVGNGEKCDFETSINGSTVIPMCDPNVSGLTCVGSNLAQNQPGVCRLLVGNGQNCGGFVFPASFCKPGLTCVPAPEVPGLSNDGPGVCRLLVGVGQKCGGKQHPDLLATCKPGLTCVFPPEVTQIPYVEGVCQAITTSTVTPTQTAIVGDPCADIVCPALAGVTCVVENQIAVCRKIAQLGERCEGFTPPEDFARCAPGLTCVFRPQETGVPQITDEQGVCQAITTSTVTATQTTSTVRPTQTSTEVYPTDIVVGAASGITAFGFASMIALFL